MNKTTAIIFFMLCTSSCFTDTDKKNRDKFILALELFDKEKYSEAILHLDTLQSVYPANDAVWCLKGRSLFALGYEDEGIKALDKAIAINNANYSAYRYRALMKGLQKDSEYEGTIRDFDIALREYPTDTGLALNKASFSFKQGYLNEAKEALDLVLALDSLNYSARIMKSSIAGKLGDNMSALKGLNEIISNLDSFPPSAYEERAFIYMKLEKFDSAIVDYEMLLHHSNLFVTYPVLKAYTLNNLGYAQCKAGDIAEGLDNIKKSIDLEPSNPYAYRNRGEIMILEGKIFEGCIDLKKAKDLGFADLYGDEVDNLIKRYCK